MDFNDWDEDFARTMAPRYGITGGLTARHWEVIRFIRDTFEEYGHCPLVYHTCKANGLRLRDLKELFPTGYLRGACRLAGVTYKQGYHDSGSLPAAAARPRERVTPELPEVPTLKVYTIDVHGFLIDPEQWDEDYATHRARDMKIAALTDRHWRLLNYLRAHHAEHGVVPTVYEACADNGLELEDLEQLFSDGYHRGAVKLAGLRAL
jgi:tRNA 2-thiouridine synthesizing protein E